MKSPKEFADVRRYNVCYSRFILKLEIFVCLLFFCAVLFNSSSLRVLLPATIIFLLLAYIFFQKYSIVTQFDPFSAIEFRSGPERLIWYDSKQQKDFPREQVEVMMTRWFVLLKLGDKPSQMNRLVLKDSFDDTRQYASFRRQLSSGEMAHARRF